MDFLGDVTQVEMPVSHQYATSDSTGISQGYWQVPATPDEGNGDDCDEMLDYATSEVPSIPVNRAVSGNSDHVASCARPDCSIQMPWITEGNVRFATFHLGHDTGCPWHILGLEGINASEERPTSDTYEEGQHLTLKSTRKTLSRPGKRHTEAQKDRLYRQPHLDYGLMNGKHCCSCGKVYTRAFRLRQHIEVQSGHAGYRCLVCSKVFGREDSLRRHKDTKHNGGKVACPGCQKCFRMDYFPKHLASAQRESCRIVAEAIHLQANIVPEGDTNPDPKAYWISSIADKINEGAKPLEKFRQMKAYQEPTHRQLSGRPCPPCDICGLALGPGDKDLIRHIRKHSLEFSTKKHKCDICQISFVYEADLCRHQDAARGGVCGFNIHHDGESKGKCRTRCSGHHPPPARKLFSNEHKRMQETLWAWEICQLRAHRRTIGYLLAARLQSSQTSRNVLPEERLKAISIWRELGVGLRGMDPALSRDLPQEGNDDNVERAIAKERSDSTGDNGIDFTPGWENSLSRPVSPHFNSTGSVYSGAGHGAGIFEISCLERLRLATGRGRPGLEALGVDYRTEDATLAFSLNMRPTNGMEQMQSVMLVGA